MTIDPWSVLTPHQATITRAFLAERAVDRHHLVVYLSGAHAYGFPSPDSDLDLKCVHVAPTGQLVGLEVIDDPSDRIEVREGVELDYGSNELAPVLRGILKGNGNYLERILGPLALAGDRPALAELRTLVRAVLSRRLGKHYRGFAVSQLELFEAKPSAKRALYVLRTTATGRHLLASGEVVTDVGQLGAYLPAELPALIAIKQQGERQLLDAPTAHRWRGHLAVALEAVATCHSTSVLPVEPLPAAVAELSSWLRERRRTHW